MVELTKARHVSNDTPLAEFPALETTDLTKSYGERVAVDGMNLSIERGELVALVGSNGAGKSTLLQLAAGLLDPTSGSVTIEGAAAGSLTARGLVSFVPDQPSLYDDLSVNEHIEYVARLHGLDGRPDTADELLELLELDGRADDLPARFSRGLRQKTSVLLGLVRPFAVLLVDEPFVGLDPSGQRTLVELVEGAVAAGAAVLLATHQLTFLDRATRCIALSDGRVAYSGPVDRAVITDLLE
jgi:ABC-2 type transport system ATP-binding protein